MKVKFVPQNVEFEIKPGQSVMHVAQDNGLYIKSVCKGVPSCAECRVRVIEGDHNVLPPGSEELSLIGTGHFIDRRRLSCQLKCFGDITVDMNEQIAKEQGLIIGQKKKNAQKNDRVEQAVVIRSDERSSRDEDSSGGEGGAGGDAGSGPSTPREGGRRDNREPRGDRNRDRGPRSDGPRREGGGPRGEGGGPRGEGGGPRSEGSQARGDQPSQSSNRAQGGGPRGNQPNRGPRPQGGNQNRPQGARPQGQRPEGPRPEGGGPSNMSRPTTGGPQGENSPSDSPEQQAQGGPMQGEGAGGKRRRRRRGKGGGGNRDGAPNGGTGGSGDRPSGGNAPT